MGFLDLLNLGTKKEPHKYNQKIAMPKTAQNTIPFIECYDNGIFLTEPDTYTLIFAFNNIDYTLFRDEEKLEVYNSYMRLLNSLPIDISYQEFIMNSTANTDKLSRVLLPKGQAKEVHGELYDEYCRMTNDNIKRSETAASEKLMLICLSYKPTGAIDNVNNLFKYYNELKVYFTTLKSDTKQLSPEQVFAVYHEFYHPFDKTEFLMPKNIYANGGRIKDYIAPSMFAFRSKYIEMGEAFSRVLFVQKFDRETDDEFVRDLLDNNKKITVSKHLKRIDKTEALGAVNKQILAVQEQIQKRMETNHKRGTNFIPYKYREKSKELEDLQDRLSESTCELFELGIFVAISAETKEQLEELTLAIRAKAMKHQVKLDVLMNQQKDGLATILPTGINKFSVANGNNVNSNQLTETVGTLIPFSTRTYFSENGIPYGFNKMTQSIIVLDRTDEMNANGFTVGSSGSGKSMFTKAEIFDVQMLNPNDEIIVIDPENEYLSLVKQLNGEIFKLSASSPARMNIFDTDLNYSEEGMTAISMKAEFIMTFIQTAKGSKLLSSEQSMVDRVVKMVYKPFEESNGDKSKLPTLKDFYETLLKQPEPEAKDIAMVLEIYVKGSFQSFSDKTNIDLTKKFIVIDIFEMGEQLYTVGLQIILEFLWQRVIENKKRGVRTWVWVDEFSMLFQNESSAKFFSKVYKRIRKHGGVASGITQNITEVLENKQACLMLGNSEFVVLLQQKAEDLAKLTTLFSLSPSQAEKLKTGERGTGLIICGQKIIPFEKILPKDNLIYKICSSNFKEQQQFQEEAKVAENL